MQLVHSEGQGASEVKDLLIEQSGIAAPRKFYVSMQILRDSWHRAGK